VQADLLPHVSHYQSRIGLQRLGVSDRHHERVETVALAVGVELREQQRYRASFAQVAHLVEISPLKMSLKKKIPWDLKC
jgi:aminoglycoside phosphotransferase